MLIETDRWEAKYDAGVRRSLDYPDTTLVNLMRESAREIPEAPALIFKGRTMSYARLAHLSSAFSAALRSLGVHRGDRVALVLPNSPQALICLFGVWAAGAIAVPVNPLYTDRELAAVLHEVGCETAVVLTPFYRKVKNIQSVTGIRRVIATNIKEYLPVALRALFTIVKEKKEGHRITLDPGDHWLQELLRDHDGSDAEIEVAGSDAGLILFTGGTTGVPKGAVGRHRAIVASGMQFREWFKRLLDPRTDVIMMNMPMFHVIGIIGVLATAIVNRNPICLVPNPRDIDDLLHTIESVKPAFLPGVPTLYAALLNHPKVKSGHVSLKSLKLCISAAAPLMIDTKVRFERLTGGRIVEGYSLTESMLGAVMTPLSGADKPGSVGLPLPDISIRVVDADGRTDLPAREVGEILMRAPQMMHGYWNRPSETTAAIRNGWLYTGDLGYIDEEGFLFVVDRKKDVIKTSGFQVWPREVEEVLASHPAVAEAGVGAIPDEYQGEAVKAWVVLRPGDVATTEDLREYCREKLTGYKVPKEIELRSELPKSLVGKVLRRQLREEAR